MYVWISQNLKRAGNVLVLDQNCTQLTFFNIKNIEPGRNVIFLKYLKAERFEWKDTVETMLKPALKQPGR